MDLSQTNPEWRRGKWVGLEMRHHYLRHYLHDKGYTSLLLYMFVMFYNKKVLIQIKQNHIDQGICGRLYNKSLTMLTQGNRITDEFFSLLFYILLILLQ